MAHSTPTTDSLIVRLNSGNTSSAELEQATGKSQSWVSTALRSLITQRRVVRVGSRRGARYALRRDIAPIGSAWPLYRVGRDGEPIELGTLYALVADEFYLEATKAATAAGFAVASLSAGIPYLLQDQRPGGFLGRAIPQRFPQLHAPPRIQDWTDEHYLRYLTTYESDVVGDLILGRPALDDYLLQLRQLVPRDARQRDKYFPDLADQSMHGGVPGSSAQGEHPKFAVTLAEQGEVHHALVKFSPPVETEVGRRWSDLLVAEHLALETLGTAGISSAKSRIFQFENRTYLEVDRFDRVGLTGRVGVTSLRAIDTGFYGALDNWIASAQRLHQERRIDMQTLNEIRLISSFADLIANTDKHFGNLAFYDSYDGRFRLTPVYDMLPMLFAPAHDQLVARIYTPADPTSDTLNVWGRARSLAEEYWRSLANEPRISAEFRTICDACFQTLESLPRTGAYSPRIAADGDGARAFQSSLQPASESLPTTGG
jgi:HipA-like C-terminal domain